MKIYIPKVMHAYRIDSGNWYNVASVMDGKQGYPTMAEADDALRKYCKMYKQDTGTEFEIVGCMITVEED